MAVRMMLAVCAMAMLLAGCGIADKNSAMPEFLRQPKDTAVPPEVLEGEKVAATNGKESSPNVLFVVADHNGEQRAH